MHLLCYTSLHMSTLHIHCPPFWCLSAIVISNTRAHHPDYPKFGRGYIRPEDMRGSARDVVVILTREDLCNHADCRSQRPSLVIASYSTASVWHT